MFPGGLKTLASLLVRRNTRGPRSWTSCCFNESLIPTTTSPSLAPIPFFSRLTFSNPACTTLFFPLRHHRCLPLTGPLFLSSPASKLSQSATPLYLRGKDDAIFPIDLPRLAMLQLMVAGSEHQTGTLPLASSPPAVVEDSFLNLPNFISITRMLSGPLIAWMVMNEWYLLAFCGLVISGATDWLDGFLARKMNINSVYGSYLDPLADKVLIGCVALAMVEKNLLHPGLVWLVVLRDVGLVSGAVYKRASSLGWEWRSWSDFVNLDATHRRKVEPLLISKVNTVLQLLLVAAALLQPEFGSRHSELYITYLSWLVASTTIASAYSYGAHHLQNTKTLVTPK